jgi:hypothetical protein
MIHIFNNIISATTTVSFIDVLFIDALSYSDHMESNDRLISNMHNWKVCVETRQLSNLKTIPPFAWRN